MLITKLLEYSLKLTPVNMFHPSIKELCLELLTNLLINKCYKSCFIVKIIEIIECSDREIVETKDTSAIINVKFTVSAHVFDKHEIIFGTILKKETNFIIAENDIAVIKIITKNPEIYTIGAFVPISIDTTRYNIGSNKVTIIAVSFNAYIDKNIYLIEGITDFKNNEDITNIILKIKHQRNIYNDVKSENKQYFSNLISTSIKSVDKMYKWKDWSETDIKLGLITQDFSKDVGIKWFSSSDLSNAKRGDSIGFIVNLLNNYLKHMILLTELNTVYSTKDLLKKMSLIWLYYKNSILNV